MKQTLDAIYEDGVFKPLESPQLPEGQHVRLEVETESEETPNDMLDLAGQVYEGLTDKQIDEIEEISLSRDDFFGDGVG